MSRIPVKMRTVLILILLLASRPLHAGELRISVAASMTDLFKGLITTFEKNHSEAAIISNFGPSGGLAKQIDQGAPVDLYVSANPKWMAFLAERNRIDVATQRVFAHNALVFVGGVDSGVSSLMDIATLDRIGIGSPAFVPAGQYAKQALENAGLYHQLLKSGKLVMAKDVRQALIYADRGEAGGSFIYRTDARLARHAKVLFQVDPKLYDRVTCPVAITATGTENADARKFYHYILSDGAKGIILRYGFALPE